MTKNRKHIIRWFWNTVAGRVTIIIATLVLPLNLIALGLLYTSFMQTRDSFKNEIANSVKIAANDLQADISDMKRQLLYEAISSTEVIRLREGTKLSETEEYEAVNKVAEKLNRLMIAEKTVGQIYYYFKDTDRFFTSNYIGIEQSAVKELVRARSEEEAITEGRYQSLNYLGKPYLISRDVYKGLQYGIMIQLNMLSGDQKYVSERGEREFFLGNEDGSIITADGETYLSKQGITFGEIKNSSRYYLIQEEIGETGLYVYEIVPMSDINAMVSLSIRIILILLSIFAVAMVPLLVTLINKEVIRPLRLLNEAMDRIEAGETAHRIHETKGGMEFKHIDSSFNAMLDQLDKLKIDMYEQQLEQKNVRLQYLSHQIQPHFILNALNILYSYEQDEYDMAQKMIMCISRYFRYIVYANDKFVPLGKEMDHVANYFEIQKARYPDLFYSIVEYDESIAEALIPPLVIQTFAENAIKNSLRIGNRITIYLIAEQCEAEGRRKVRIRLADTGEGIPDEILEEIRLFKETGEAQPHLGVGIQNTIERFKVLYGDQARVDISREEGDKGTNVEILLPCFFRGDGDAAQEEFPD